MRHPGSGPQHTLSPQPSLTDGRGEERRGGRGRWGGAEVEWGLHTNHSQINSLLPQSTILPPSSLPHLSLFLILLLLLHPFHVSSLIFSNLCLSSYSALPSSVSMSSPPCLICYVSLPGLSLVLPGLKTK